MTAATTSAPMMLDWLLPEFDATLIEHRVVDGDPEAVYGAVAHWGANCEELRKPLPGDELVPGPAVQSTRAVTIEAPVAAVWPWLAQLGQDRGGFYSYLHPLSGLPVARFDADHVLVLEGWGAFVLEPVGAERTRLIARGRIPRGAASLVNALLMEIPHFVMERKMLLRIKERAERAYTAETRRAAQSAPIRTPVHV